MQILPSTAASAAAGNVSQATSRDRGPGATSEAAHLASPNGVERIARGEAADADRDAQGGGQGLGARGEHAADTEASAAELNSGLPVSSFEEPSQLDIVG
ncbi:MAG: hypothetical protein ACTHK7_22125 [Aureliella sp.]